MNTSPTEGSRILANLRVVLATLAGAAALLLAFMQVPQFAAWARAPLISPLVAALIGLVLAIAATVLVTVVRAAVRRQRDELEATAKKEHTELETIAKTKDDELEATKAKNLHLESALQDLRIAVFYDVLTGVPNSRYLKHLLDDERRTSDQTRCLILLDLENFGEINKKHNHWKGDEYLSRFAAKLLESSRRNEYVIERRPPHEEEPLEIQAFRRYSGGDEFYILLNGPLVDGLGYLNRLHRRAEDFEKMAVDALGSPHHFGFRAGLVSVGYQDHYETAAERACDALGKASETPDVLVYWPRHETSHLNKVERDVVEEAIANFGDPFQGPP